MCGEESRNITLRPALEEDEEFLFTVYAGRRRQEMAAWGWDEAQQMAFLRMQFRAQHISYSYGYADADHRIILLNEHPIGRILVDRTEQDILLVDIALLPEYRNAGIGSRLIGELLDEGARKRIPVRLHVEKSNPGAARLYERLGFKYTQESADRFEMIWRPDREE